MINRTIPAMAALTLLAGAGGGLSASSAARTPESRSAHSSDAKHVVLTSKTITISRATVKQYLVGISTDGTTFKFKRAAGALASLKPGKVMLLEGSDAVVVTKVSQSRGQLLVLTRSATLPDLIKSGRLSFSGRPDFRKAFLTRTVARPSGHAADDFIPPGYPYVGSPSRVLRARAASGPSISAQGSSGAFGYSLTFTPASPTRMDIAGVICFQWGSICSNGPSNGVSAEANVSGYIDAGQQDVGITVDGGRVTGSTIAIKHLVGHAHLTYTVARGAGDLGQTPPVFHIPIGIDYTIPVGGIPLYFKLQTGVLFKLGVSSHKATIHGGADVTTSGSDTVTDKGSSVSTSGSANQAQASVLGASQTAPSLSAAPSGVVVAVQFPKIGAGLGVRAANGIGYIDLVTSVGQDTGGFIGGMICSSYILDFTVGAGFEAQLGPFGIASPKKTLYDKIVKLAEPGCPQI